jgi:hypothetical protein
MRATPNVTTPGGFFVGLGGIIAFCVVAIVVYQWVKKPAKSDELLTQQVALGLRPAPELKGDDAKKKQAEANALLDAAAQRYNGGVKPDIDKLDQLRGVIRYREAMKVKEESAKALDGAIAWKDKAKGEVTMPVELAMKVIANGLKDRKPKASAVKVDIMPPADPNAVPMMPNAMMGGAKTLFFIAPNSAPAAPAPSAAPAPAPAPSAAPAPAPTTPAPTPSAAPAPAKPEAAAPAPNASASVPAPSRPPLLNWPETKK